MNQTSKQSPTERMNAISEQGLCAGCGLCQSVAGPDKIQFTKVANGYERPVVVGKLDDALVERIYAVCPGTRIEGLPESEVEADTKIDNVWGPWRRMVHAWADDAETRFEGSTAGVLTALAKFLLAEKRVDFILHVKASTTEPTFGERHLSFTEVDVIEAVGSRYGPSAPLIDIDEVLDRGQPFAFIAKPCDIAALRNLARYDGRVNRLVKYWLTMVCGGFGPPASTNAFLKRENIDPESVQTLRYRGRGCPGPTRVETTEGTVHEAHYLDFWGEDETQWQLPFRCKICPDGIGEAADIAAADSWPGGSPTREGSVDDPGVNAVVARTLVGEKLLAAATEAGFLALGDDLVPDEMSAYQPHQARKKYAAYDRHQGVGDAGRIVPKTQRLRLEALAQEMPESYRQHQRKGTQKRVEEGKATEPTPETEG